MKPITIYVKSGCHYSAEAKRLLSEKSLEFEEINVTENPSRREEMVQRAGGKNTFPQVFFGDRHIGGFDELEELDQSQGIRSALVDEGEAQPGA